MRLPYASRRVLRFAAVLVALAMPAALGEVACLGPDQNTVWLCLNPVTGHIDGTFYDSNHYVHGVFDPCHCYDPCGPLKSCPIDVDAGPPPSGCDAGGSDADPGTGGAGGG
jgi:hypothetical protein